MCQILIHHNPLVIFFLSLLLFQRKQRNQVFENLREPQRGMDGDLHLDSASRSLAISVQAHSMRSSGNMTSEGGIRIQRVCVTGAGGYIGSWLVKNLLQKGYTVNATLRDPEKVEKSGHLLSLEGAKERLNLFRAHLCEEGSFDAAVQGCQVVFHLATPMEFSEHPENPEENVIQPAVKGGLNVLKSCSRAKSVRRVVYTSSVTAASPLNNNGEYGHPSLDESCRTPVDLMTAKRPLGWMYYVSKTLTEQAVVQYGMDNQIDVLVIAPAVVAGPFLTPALPLSVAAILSPIKVQRPGIETEYEALKSVEYVLGSIPIVHIDDVCNAHIFLMEHPTARGRYICSAESLTIGEMADLFREKYGHFNVPFVGIEEGDCSVPGGRKVGASSKKLLDEGFSYSYDSHQILQHTVEWAQKTGVLGVELG